MEGIGADKPGGSLVRALTPSLHSRPSGTPGVRGRPTQHLVSVDSAGAQRFAHTRKSRPRSAVERRWTSKKKPDGRRIALSTSLRCAAIRRPPISGRSIKPPDSSLPPTALGRVDHPNGLLTANWLVFHHVVPKNPPSGEQKARRWQSATRDCWICRTGEVVRSANVTRMVLGNIRLLQGERSQASNSDLFYLPF